MGKTTTRFAAIDDLEACYVRRVVNVPSAPYIALYGSNTGAWRAKITPLFDAAQIPWFDPTNNEWDAINWSNGDRLQPTIDRLVKREQDALLGARCALWHIGRTIFEGDTPTEKTTEAFASRLELGVLLGRGLKTWVVIEDDVTGRNYLRAAVAAHASAELCTDDRDAVKRAVAWWRR
jgi:hypothetical protein